LFNYLSFCVTSLIGLARAKRPDVVFVESPPLFLIVPGWVKAKLSGAKLIFNVADLWPDTVSDLGVVRDGAMLRFAKQLEAWAYRKASYVNAVTDGIAERLRSGKAVQAEKILFLPNGVDTMMLQPMPPDRALAARLGLAGKSVFLYAGTHGIVHGLEHVLDAAAQVEADGIAVLFVGAGTRKAALVERTRALGLRNVVFHDPVPIERMPAFYSIACASIVTVIRSHHSQGARPSKMFSSLACGVPILYSGEGEGAEIVRSAGAGIVVEPESADALARGMRELTANPELRDRLGAAARSLAETRFGWSGIVESWLARLQSSQVRCTG
jgi:glycosyltransferase involved in cell wall biosynthesis